MTSIKLLYRKNIYGVMGTLLFHIILVASVWLAELKMNAKIEKEEVLLIDLPMSEDIKEAPEPEMEKQQEKNTASDQSVNNRLQSGSNRAVNDASNDKATNKKDKFFDENYNNDIVEAQKMVDNVNKQLSKKIPAIKKYEMPEATTEGQNPDSIKNVIYSGKSNIHYFLENRFHLRLPIPVYLARSGGEIKVDIQVDRSGKVLKATVASTRAGDPMLTEYAIQAAERSVFNTDFKAPSVQKGTITYKFVAQ